jgi:hypothetical protein
MLRCMFLVSLCVVIDRSTFVVCSLSVVFDYSLIVSILS